MWIAVRPRFRAFVADLEPSIEQLRDGVTKHLNVGKSIERWYDGEASDNPPCFLVGSWGKGTQVQPSQDLDMFVIMHSDVKARFDARSGNVQSALLAEIKAALEVTYGHQTSIRADGQVVAVNFNTVKVEVVPVFRGFGDQFTMPDTNNGGRWKTVDPLAQIRTLEQADQRCAGNVRALARMIKHWRNERNVPLKSFVIELLVAEFLTAYALGGSFSGAYDALWYDYYVRDFLRYLIARANGFLSIPGTGELYFLGDEWLTKAKTAYSVAVTACEWEYADYDVTAGQEWQKIFGTRIRIQI